MRYALVNVNIVTGYNTNEILRDKVVIIERNKIVAICDELTEKIKKYNLKNRYIMPGLINMHVHLPGSGKSDGSKKQTKESVRKIMNNFITRFFARKLCEHYAKVELLSGVTTIRTVAGLGNFDTLISKRIEERKINGPRLIASNMALSVPNGHMAGILAHEVRTPMEAINCVQMVYKDKPKWIKLMITGGVLDATKEGEPGVLRMPQEIVKAAVLEAHRLGLKVCAHAESRVGVSVALESGVDTVEHGATLLPNDVENFKKNKASLICTISPAIPFVEFDERMVTLTDVEKTNAKIVLKGIIDAAKTCLENNIPVGLGTDTACPFITHYDMWRELVYFSKLVGVSNAFSVHTATLRNAQILGIDNITGSIEVGKSADIIVLNDNPLEDLRTIRNPQMVIFRGKVFKHPRVKKYHHIESALDNVLDDILSK